MTDQLSVGDVAAMDDREVYERLGTALLGEAAAAVGPDPERSRQYGERWFNWKLKEVSRRLCDEDTLERLGSEPDPAEVAELLTKLGDATTVACVAVLAVRRGLDEVCEDDDDD